MQFSSILWQDAIVQSLKGSIAADKTGHAILFCGEQNTAVKLAHACADAILCDRHTGDSCGVCPACLKTAAGSHPDKIVVEKQKASRTMFGVDDVRAMISSMYIKPFFGRKKVFLFDDASHLSDAAQNALLKVLETPPPYGVILLCAQKEDDLLPTVLSRLKKYALAVPTAQQIGAYLAAKYPEKKQLAAFCAAFCDGSPYDAEALLDRGGDQDVRKRLCLFLDRLCGTQKSAVFDFAGFLETNKEHFEVHCKYLFAILRDIVFLQQKLPQTQIINSDLAASLQLLAKKMPQGSALRMTDRLSALLKDLKGYASFPLSVTDFLLKTWEDLHD